MPANPMTEEELQQWRAKRTGRSFIPVPHKSPVPTEALPHDDVPTDDAHIDDAPIDVPESGNIVSDLRQQLAAANGRVAPLQRQVVELQSVVKSQQTRMDELAAALQDMTSRQTPKAAPADFDPFADIPAEELSLLDPTALTIIKRGMSNLYAKTATADPEAVVRTELQKRDKARLDTFLRTTAAELNLTTLVNAPEFSRFIQEDDSATYLLNAFANAPDYTTAKDLVPRVKQMLKRYENSKPQQRAPDTTDRLSAHLSRQQGGSREPASVTSPAEVRRIRMEASRLSRQGEHDAARKLMSSINS